MCSMNSLRIPTRQESKVCDLGQLTYSTVHLCTCESIFSKTKMEETQLVRGKALAMLRILTLSSFKGKVNCFTLILTFYYVEAINSEPPLCWKPSPSGPPTPAPQCLGVWDASPVPTDSVFVQPGH